MRKASLVLCGVAAAAALSFGSKLLADNDVDWGMWVQKQLNDRSELLFGIGQPLGNSALGPYVDADSTQSIRVAQGLHVSLVSSAVHFSTDQIALWPNDEHPTHLFVCDESSSNPAVQRVNLSQPAASNATTVLTGIVACDPIRRTPWGSITVAEESTDGGTYEIMDPLNVTNAAVTNRATGVTSDVRVAKRKALGQLAFEGNPVLPDGTIIFGDELRPGSGGVGNPGGALFKFVPQFPYTSGALILNPAESPLAAGKLYGLRLGSTNDSGQGTEIGQGFWLAIDPALYADANGNIVLRNAQKTLKLNGFYRPEDMDIDPIALSNDEVRVCWANTGRMSNGGGSEEETGAIYGEVLCLTDEADAAAISGAVPTVRRFIAGNPQFNYFDNVAFQPHSGNIAVTEDGEVAVVKEDGTSELRGNDILLCLPDEDDDDVQSDGCVRIASLRDTSAEPTGIIFTGSGESMFVSIQHRATNVGALLKISGFDVRHNRRDHHHFGDWWPWGWGQKQKNHFDRRR